MDIHPIAKKPVSIDFFFNSCIQKVHAFPSALSAGFTFDGRIQVSLIFLKCCRNSVKAWEGWEDGQVGTDEP